MSLYVVDVAAIRRVYSSGLQLFEAGTFLLSLTLIKMFKIDVKLTMLALIPSALLFFFWFLLRQSMKEKFKVKQESFESMSDFVQESISGMAIVKAYVREAFEVFRFGVRKKNYFEKDYDFGKVRKRLWVISYVMGSLSFPALVAFGSYLAIFGNLPLAKLIVFISFFNTLNRPSWAIVELFQMVNHGNASAKRIANFLNEPTEIKDADDAIKLDHTVNGDIVFNNVTFNYPDDKNIVLNNLNFTIKEGESVGILGKTGSGKTTIIELLLRLYNLEQGSISIGGYDISKLTIENVRNAIGYVPQDNFLFSDTIKNNIAFSSKRLNDAKIIRASKQSAVYDNIKSFTQGFETILGERGTTISGGQKQRVSIARALVKNPNILILDDAVSAVDVKLKKKSYLN